MNANQSEGGNVLIPITISVTPETVRLLSEMADDMGISVDDVLSVLAEDAAIDLESKYYSLDKILIPNKCSREDLMKILNK
tara:strand:- start:1357 stop:1599 length:243 start_codon:yes stop_codon:yes gene_type:complete